MSKILLIISDPTYQNEISKILVSSGFDVLAKDSPVGLSEQIKAYSPDLLLLDGNIVQSEGCQLKQDFPLKPIIGWMNERDARLAVNLISNGAFDCIYPPIVRKEFIGIIQHALNYCSKETTVNIIKKNNWLFPTLTVVLSVLLISFFLFLNKFFMPSKVKTFFLTYQNPTGIFKLNNAVWTSDWYTQGIYKYYVGKELQLQETYFFNQYNPNTVAFINNLLWVTGTDGYIRTYELTDKELIHHNSYKSPGVSPSGLCVQNNYLWSTDAENSIIYQHLINDPEKIVAKHKYPGEMPVGLFWDGNNFWTADARTNKIYRHLGPDQGFQILDSFNLTPQGGGNLAGLTGDENSLWLVFSGQPARILRYPLNKLK